jgi:hypothetical protein
MAKAEAGARCHVCAEPAGHTLTYKGRRLPYCPAHEELVASGEQKKPSWLATRHRQRKRGANATPLGRCQGQGPAASPKTP